MIDEKHLVPFLVKNKLTIEEFFVLHLKYLEQKMLLTTYKRGLYKDNANGILSIASKQKLIRLGYLVKDETTEKDRYHIGDAFKAFYADEYTIGNELWNAYPAFTSINGKNAPLKSTNKQGLRKKYFKAIGGLKAEHDLVMQDLKFGVDGGYIKNKIVDFVDGEMWADLRNIRLNEGGKNSVTTTNDDYDF